MQLDLEPRKGLAECRKLGGQVENEIFIVSSGDDPWRCSDKFLHFEREVKPEKFDLNRLTLDILLSSKIK